MKNITISIFVVLLLFLIFWSLHNSEGYKGDGVLTDNGTFADRNRYVLDLGKIQLNRKGEYSYSMSELPHVEMVVGLSIATIPLTTESLIDNQISSTTKIILTDSKGKNVINEEGSLRDWVWSGSLGMKQRFIYRKGQEIEIKTGERTSIYKRTGVTSDAGWGTYFTPRNHESYKLFIAVVPTESAGIAQMANVQVIGGGWK